MKEAADGELAIRPEEFQIIRDLLYAETGITLAPSKSQMVGARLAKRLRRLEMTSLTEYLRLLRTHDPKGEERQQFINCLTTNKTDFFREKHHFDFLRDVVIPQCTEKRRIRIWSAACSTGEEPYTLAMTLLENCPKSQGWDVRITASDIDTNVLAAAQAGEYDAERADIPKEYLKKYFLQGTGQKANKIAARKELRAIIDFRQVNLMKDRWPVDTELDAIFCRNVIIYFDRPTQEKLMEKLMGHLDPNGYLFLGHSENLHWMADRFVSVAPTTFQVRGPDTPVRGKTSRSATSKSPSRIVVPGKATPAKGIAAKPAQAKAAPAKVTAPEHTLIIGQVKVTHGPAILKTLLGSCVAACLYDPETKIGGMNHFSLPGVSDSGVSARYGAHAMEMLITALMKEGANRDRLRAKVFGGANVINFQSGHSTVGDRNAEFVVEFLKQESIPLEGKCLGGTKGLMVRFHPDTGRALAKPLPERELTTILHEEEKFSSELTQKAAVPADDGIELF